MKLNKEDLLFIKKTNTEVLFKENKRIRAALIEALTLILDLMSENRNLKRGKNEKSSKRTRKQDKKRL